MDDNFILYLIKFSIDQRFLFLKSFYPFHAFIRTIPQQIIHNKYRKRLIVREGDLLSPGLPIVSTQNIIGITNITAYNSPIVISKISAILLKKFSNINLAFFMNPF